MKIIVDYEKLSENNNLVMRLNYSLVKLNYSLVT
jgi:hypothetical protein